MTLQEFNSLPINERIKIESLYPEFCLSQDQKRVREIKFNDLCAVTRSRQIKALKNTRWGNV